MAIGLFAIPIAGWPTRYFDNQVLSVAALLVCSAALAILWAIECLSNRALFLPHKSVLIPAAIALFALFISTVAGIHPLRSFIGDFDRLEGLVTWIGYLGLFFFAGSRRFEKKEIDLIAGFSIAAAVIASLLGIAQYLGFTATPVGLGYESYRAYSTFGNPILFGSYLALSMALAFALMIEFRRWRRIAFGASAVTMAGALLATLSRGAILGALISLVVFFSAQFTYFKRSAERKRKRRQAVLTACTALIAIAFVAISGVGAQVASRFTPAALMGGGAKTRFLTYEVALSSIAIRPLIGYGPESFEGVFMRDRTDRYVESEGIRSVNDRSHNVVLDLLVDGGVLLLVAFFALVGASLFRLWGSGGDLTVFAMTAGSIGYIASLLFSFGAAGTTGPLFAFLAIVSGNTRGALEIKPRSSYWLRVASVAAAALSAFLILGTSFYVASAYYYKRGAVLLRQGDIVGAIDRFKTASSVFPWESMYFQAMGRAQANLVAARMAGETISREAYESYERAVSLDPTNRDALFCHALFNMTFLSSERVYVEEAKSLLERNLALDPYAVWARAALADCLELMGDKERADEERERAMRTAMRFGAEKDPFIAKSLKGAVKKLLDTGRSTEAAEHFLKNSGAKNEDYLYSR